MKKKQERRSGQPADPAKRLEVLALYANLDNAAEAGRQAGVPERTAREYVTRAQRGDDPEGAAVLAEARRELRARALGTARRALTNGVIVTSKRLTDPKWLLNFKIDGTPHYLTALSNAYRSLMYRADRGEDPEQITTSSVEGLGPVEIHLHAASEPPKQAGPAPDAPPSP